MSFPSDDEEFQGIDCFVLALEELSRKADEFVESSGILSSSEPQFTGWIVDRSVQNESKPVGQRRFTSPKDSKEHRSTTPRKTVSRQFTRNREDTVEFKHHVQPGRYIEEYRNGKAIRQENAYKELLNKNDRRRASETCVDFGKNCDNTENVASKHVPSVVSMKEEQTAEGGNAVKPLIVVSSKGSSRPANLPLSGQFQGRKLQWRPTIGNRKITYPKGSQWSQTHIDVTLEIKSQGNGDVSHLLHSNKQSEDYNPLQERRPSANLVIKRAELNTSASTSSRAENKTLSASPQTISAQNSPIEKCDAWVKNRENELGNISSKSKEQHNAKSRTFRHNASHCTSSLALRGNALTSPHKDATESPSNVRCSSSSSRMDYSKYTDMFKNVLEFYGTRRLRPKSHSAIEQLLSMKT